jgi:hypothetical protein
MNTVRITVIKLSRQGDILKERNYKRITIRISKIRLSGLIFGIRNYIITVEYIDRKSFYLVRLIGKTKILFTKRTVSNASYEHPISK